MLWVICRGRPQLAKFANCCQWRCQRPFTGSWFLEGFLGKPLICLAPRAEEPQPNAIKGLLVKPS